MLLSIETQILNGTITQAINFDDPDITAFIGIAIGGITAFFLWYQIRKQTKVDSARFTIDFIDKLLKENRDVIDELNERSEDSSKKFKSDKSVRVLLNGFENAVQFANDGLIKKTHLQTTLRITLTLIKNDSEVQRIIKEAQEKKKTAFVLVKKFLDDNIV